MHRLLFVLTVLAVLTAGALGQSSKQRRSPGDGEIVAQDVFLSGTKTLSSTQLSEISSILSSVTMHDNDEEVEERIKYEFMQRGYFDAEVTNLKVTVLDPLAKKKPVRVEADVSEGPQFRLAALIFKNNKAFSAEELRPMFTIQDGAIFNAEMIRLGLEAMRNEYTARGFLNFAPVPDTQKSGSQQITVTFDMNEGPQFLMGELKINGPGDVAQKLSSYWPLKTGEPFDPAILEKFLTTYRGELPESFNSERDVVVMQDCPLARVDVSFFLDNQRPGPVAAQSKPCETKDQQKPSTH